MFESWVIAGVLLGAVEGFKPGPLQTLVITETLKRDWKAGLKVTLAPLVTDGPIILLCALVVSSLSNYGQFFAFISFAGAIFLLYMAYETFIIDEVQIDEGNSGNSPFYKGIITNLLNPNPYVYWTLIGSPFLIKAFEEDVFLPFVFLFS
ncbi:MAG: LysE family transporter [Candidatus Poseidoniia archaeon]|jgi:threonine/homoserine/homoserine lactone efflux protein|nr:LysE family transporter [Candidatus Poseidoniia archaeon]MDP6592041.1 LysE family transporter [Candidatus Poseidoniia archaeon]MDP7188033.1 LysE family transporter [Candidatus Poseidoniia archaeon]MDP7665693.1 LysE family transporter [Candidatus Poseidoniia archaeon]HJN31548.1 LysE family transporter [Candidatus Poseidoniia archaeon]